MIKHNEKTCIGIDVSKDTLDIYFSGKSYKIQNNIDCICAFIKAQIQSNDTNLLCVMESTGGYERNAAKAFTSFNIAVHVAHPNKAHSFAKACGHFAKTDRLDAILLYKYAKFIANEEEGDIIFDDVHHEIITLRRLSKSIETNLHAAQCRLKQMPSLCMKYLETEIALYKQQIMEIQKEIDDRISKHPDLKAKRDIMVTIKGVGAKVASILLAEVPELGNLSRRAVASLLGVAPRTFQSGKKEMAGHITGGRFYARKALYIAALVASKHDQTLKNKYQHLQERGKAKKVALVALMRSIIIAINSMLKKSKIFLHTT